jgi:hypothetical protein
MRAAFALCLLATAASAQTPMTADEFESWSSGKTLDYFDGASFWGSEQHLAERATLDADAGGTCVKGYWYPRGDDICFVYEPSPGPHCWRFLRDGDAVFALIVDNPDAPLFSVTLSDAPISCAGPDVGV